MVGATITVGGGVRGVEIGEGRGVVAEMRIGGGVPTTTGSGVRGGLGSIGSVLVVGGETEEVGGGVGVGGVGGGVGAVVLMVMLVP